MHRKIRFIQIVFLIVSAIVIVEFFKQTDINIFDVRYPTFLEIVFLLASSIGIALVGALLWCEISYFVIGRRSKLSLAIVNNGLLLIGKYIPGKIWGVAARAIINKKVKFTTSETVTISIIEFLSSTIFSILLGFSLYIALRNELSAGILVTIFIFGCGLFVLCLLFTKSTLTLIKHFNNRFKIIDIPRIGVHESTLILLFLLLYWSSFAIGLNGLISFLDINAGFRTTLFILGAYIFSVTAGFLAVIAPGGIGVREATFTGLCVGVIDLEKAVELAVFIRIWLTLFELLLGIASIAIMGKLKNI